MAKWCNLINCWCNDAKEIVDQADMCDFECEGCEESEEIK